MDAPIKQLFRESILHEALHRYGIAPEQLRPIPGFRNLLYEFDREHTTYILRIGHSSRRSFPLVHGELDWITYLAIGGVAVASPIPSLHGRLVEPLTDGHGEHFLATVFAKAPGKRIDSATWNATLFERYGQTIGRMHALTTAYTPTDSAWRRPHWDEDIQHEAERIWPATEMSTFEKFHKVLRQVRALPREAASYGLIHQDAHAGNFFVDAHGTITFFDF
jgi:amicoumacin kinase